MSSIYILGLLQQSVPAALVFILSLIAAVSVHEFAHAWTAYKLGDDTPYLAGRVTLNPAAHLDPVGSLLFLLLGMGWGRPVIYNPMRLPRRVDELLIALAGPGSNLLFALCINILIALVGGVAPYYADVLSQLAFVNIALAAFNLIPIPPLDGSSIISYFWPPYRSLISGQFGLLVLLIVVFMPIGPGGNLIGLLVTPGLIFFNSLTHLFGIL